MSTLLRIILVASVLITTVMIVLGPRRARTLGQRLRLIAYLYVLAVLIGAALQLAGLRY